MTTKAELLARTDALLPRIGERAEAADRNGAVADDTIADLVDAGVFATLAPKRYGGHELDLHVFSQIVRKISSVSPSTGWVTAFLMGAAWRLLAFGQQAQEEIYADRNYVLGAGSAQPIQSIEVAADGYVLNGRTGWNSGASHAEWFSVNGVARHADGRHELLTFAVPRSDVKVLDTWHILGMQGTASCDLEFDRVFVPRHRSTSFIPLMEGDSPGHALHDNILYRIPFVPFAMTEVLPVVVGTHRGAANALGDRVRTRLGTLSGAKAAEKVPAQIRFAQADARATMAEQMLTAMVDWNMGGLATLREPQGRAKIKLHASMVTAFCLDSVNDMARSVGGDALRDEAPFQRYFRDMNTVARHAFLDPDTAAETYARMELGHVVGDRMI